MFLVTYPRNSQRKRWQIGDERISIGRSSRADIMLSDARISRIHAYIIKDGDKYIFADAHSTNGSFINNVRVNRRILNPGDVIKLGDTELHVLETDDNVAFSWQENPVIIKKNLAIETSEQSLEQLTLEMFPEKVDENLAATTEHTKSQAVRKFVQQIKTLYQACGHVSALLNRHQLYEHVIQSVFQLLPNAENACLIIDEEANGNFKPVLMRNRSNKSQQTIHISRTAFQQAVTSKTTLLAADVPNDPLFQKVDTASRLHLQSILCAPLIYKDEVIGAIYADNREEKGSFDLIDAEFFTALANHSAMAIQHVRLYDSLQTAYHQSIMALQNVMEARDPNTMGHTYRTSQYGVGIAREMGLSEEQCYNIKTAAELHDIGKIAIDINIINKAGDLSCPEYLSVQEHVNASEKILAPVEYLRQIIPIIRQHHERYDGTGYPEGLHGDDILPESRILAVADTFDALTSERSYKGAMTLDESLQKCKEEAGKAFDPEVVDALERYIHTNRARLQHMLENPSETI